MATDAQLAKAYGHLSNVSLADLAGGHAEMDVDDDVRLLLKNRDCLFPDTHDEEVADADPQDLKAALDLPLEQCEWIKKAQDRLGRYNNQRWPKGCYDSHPDVHASKLYVDWSRVPAHNMRPCTTEEMQGVVESGVWGFDSVAKVREFFGDVHQLQMMRCADWMSREAFRRGGWLLIDADGGENGDHHLHVTHKPIPGNTEGIGWFPNGRCDDHVNQHIDTTRKGLHQAARLLCHENGHCGGEPHQFPGQREHASVMSYTRPRTGLFYGFSTGKAPYPAWLPKDRSLQSLLDKYGGPIGDPVTPAPPETNDVIVATFTDLDRVYTVTRKGGDDGIDDDPVVDW